MNRMAVDKKKSTLEEEVKAEVLRARFQINSPKFSATPASIVTDFFQLPGFVERLVMAAHFSKEKGLEAGFSCSIAKEKGLAPLDKAKWGEVVVGGVDEIRFADDARGEYFTHTRGAVPLFMCHFHPSGNLGLSRADCLTADVIVRESMMLLKTKVPAFLSPIFAVAVHRTDVEIEMLLVQRKRSGEFMAFEAAGFGFDLSSWLAAPEFNVGHIRFLIESGMVTKIDFLQDQIVQPLR